jgi:hypothetical protein
MPELERMLRALGDELDWPSTPDLAPAVTGRLAEPARRPGRLPIARRSLALAFVLLLVLAGAAYAAFPGVRDAVRDLFGIQGATVERRSELPPPPPAQPLQLGTPTTLDDANVAFTPLVPSDPGAPDRVFVRRTVPGGELSLIYRPRAGLPRARSTKLGLLVTEFRGDLSPDYLKKVVGPATTVKRLSLDGEPALWIEGAPHYFFYRAPDGSFPETPLRIAQNVLLLDQGKLLVRLEGAFDRERAIEIARSLR